MLANSFSLTGNFHIHNSAPLKVKGSITKQILNNLRSHDRLTYKICVV